MEIRVNEEDQLKLLEELKHLRQQVTRLQARGTKLLLENRDLKAQIKILIGHPENWEPR